MFSLVMKILDVPPPLYHSTQVKRYSSDVFTIKELQLEK